MKRLALTLMLLLGCLTPAFAALDEVHQRLLRQFDLPLRWDNVEGPPLWVDGVRPAYRAGAGLHLVALDPGREVLVRVPEGEILRLVAATGELAPEDLRVSLSEGSGLHQAVPLVPSDDGRSLLVLPPADKSRLARVALAPGREVRLELALFLSRRETLGELAPYRNLIDLPGRARSLRSWRQAAGERFWRLDPGFPVEVQVAGPARLALESRLNYPRGESEPRQTYWVWTRLVGPGGEREQRLEFTTTAELSGPVAVDGRPRPLARLEAAYLEVPPGRHMLRLEVGAPLYLRLLARQDPDYLLPAFNAPDPPAEELAVAPAAPLAQAPREGELASAPLAPSEPAALQEPPARTLARDNAVRGGGLAAAAIMARSAAENPDDPRIRELAERLWGSHTYYRDLLPEYKLSHEPQRFGWVLAPDLRPPARGQPEPAVRPDQEQALRERLTAALFFPVVRPDEVRLPRVTRMSERRLQILLEGDVLFDTDRSALRPEARSLLLRLAEVLAAQPVEEVRVIGHTDSRASDDYNQGLSERRAGAVAGFLIRAGLPPGLFQVEGRGEREPRADNDSEAGMQRNRRVEIWVERAGGVEEVVLERRLRYLLPQRSAPGRLRILADPEGAAPGQECMVQIDDGEPRLLQFTPGPELPAADYLPADGAIGLGALQERFAGFDEGTLGGPFAQRQVPASLLAAGVAELELPAAARKIRLWRVDPGSETLRVALQYRAARPFALTETGWLALAERLPRPSYELFLALLRGDEPATEAEAEFANHWLPLHRWLESRSRFFAAPVSSDPLAPAFAMPRADDPALLEARARELEKAGQPLSALENWSRLLRQLPAGDLDLRREGELARVRLLRRLGQEYLAERLLRWLMLTSPDPELANRAFLEASAQTREAGDGDALLSLLAARFLQQPDPALLRQLAEVLVEEGDDERALSAGLVLPADQRPLPALVRAAFRQRWWQAFSRLTDDLPEAQRRLWLGHRALEQGDFAAMRHAWAHLEGAGLANLNAWTEGARIHGRLLAADPGRREAAIRAWESWEADHPGPRQWQGGDHLVRDSAGGATLYTVDLDRSEKVYRTLPGHPLRLQLWGPARLRIEGRPLHEPGPLRPLDGWIEVRSRGGLHLLPVTGNLPSSGLDVVGEERLPGYRVAGEVEFGPGLHEVNVGSPEFPLLLRTLVAAPDPRLPSLPPLTPETVLAASRGELAGSDDHPWPVATPDVLSTAALEELRRLEARLAPQRPVSEEETLAGLVAQGDFSRALARTDLAPLTRMVLLLRWAESEPARLPEFLARAERLAQDHPETPGLQPLLTRLERGSHWAPITTLTAGAGVRLLPVTGWEPQSPDLRVRRTLLAPLAADEQVLVAGQRLVLALAQPRATELELTLAGEDLFLLPQAPLTAAVQLDDGPLRSVELAPGAGPQTLRLQVPAGHHRLQVAPAAPLVNQFLRVRVLEVASGLSALPAVERTWQVATAAEPVRCMVAGPAWLRIDSRENGEVLSEYRAVAEGWQEVVVAPAPGAGERLVRLYQKEIGLVPPAAGLRHTAPPLQPVPPAPVMVADAPPATRVALDDVHPLGGQEDGTWSAYLAPERRRSVDGVGREREPEQFVELGLAHRYFAEHLRSYLATEGLVRLREDGGPVLGAAVTATWYPWARPVAVEGQGQVFLQDPGNPSAPRGERLGTEWSARLRFSLWQTRELSPKGWHRPKVSLFARALSLDEDDRLDRRSLERLDQDVFTPYKAEHRFGLTLGDRLSWRPWLDTLWYGGLSLTSNEDFNLLVPDRVDGEIGWRQLVRPFVLHAGYRLNYFFDDHDRSGDFDRHTLVLDLLWEKWLRRAQRLEVGLGYRYDLTDEENLGLLALRWHFGNGRGYRDFRPGEIDFEDLRERWWTLGPNNLMRIERGTTP